VTRLGLGGGGGVVGLVSAYKNTVRGSGGFDGSVVETIHFQ